MTMNNMDDVFVLENIAESVVSLHQGKNTGAARKRTNKSETRS